CQSAHCAGRIVKASARFAAEISTRSSVIMKALRLIRAWMRFLHTGQALGGWGQLVAGLACLGALLLVYTGVALSWRRFFPRGA
ncbi:MAG: hypothetical protein HGA66_14025, partial [Holophaga sp.]|nr:hypothetical protein [Holophaga sp.]